MRYDFYSWGQLTFFVEIWSCKSNYNAKRNNGMEKSTGGPLVWSQLFKRRTLPNNPMDNCASFDALILWMEGKLLVSSFTENGECSAEFESSQKSLKFVVSTPLLRDICSYSAESETKEKEVGTRPFLQVL